MSDSDLTTLIAEALREKATPGLPGQPGTKDDGQLWGAFPNSMTLDDLAAHVASVLSGVYAITPLPETTRWYTAAYRADNGNVIPVGVEYVKQCWADEVRHEWQCDEPDGKYFVAHRDVPAWQETPQ